MARLPRLPRTRPVLAPDIARNEVAVLRVGTEISRIYFAGGGHPGDWKRFRPYGPTSARFDHHLPSPGSGHDRAIAYAGSNITTTVAEVFQDGVIDVVSDDPYYAILRLRRDVRLLSLRSDWPTRAGASQALASGTAHASSRGWSIAIYEDLADIEGIEFDSSMHYGGVNYALYERAEDAFEPSPVVNLPLSHRGLRAVLRNIAVDLNFELALPTVRGSAAIIVSRLSGAPAPRRRVRHPRP